MAIEQFAHAEFVQNYLDEASAEMNLDLASTEHSAVLALGNANATNNVFVQGQVAQLALNDKLTTAIDDALDEWLAQFAIVFPGRIAALQAKSAPVPPTNLVSPATTTYLRLASVQKVYNGQNLRLTRGIAGATAIAATAEPTTTLTTSVSLGATTLTVGSTSGMFTGGVLKLVDGIYNATATIQNVNSSTSVTISALTSTLNHAFSPTTTVITLVAVVSLSALVLDSGTLITDLTTGTQVKATTLLEGQRFFRNNPDNTTPLIPATNGATPGYRVQTKLNAIAYEVIPDLTNPAYDATVNAYRMPANAVDVYVTIQAVAAGIDSNVAANQLVLLPSQITGIDGTSNLYPITNGADKESNDAVKTRFRNFMLSQNSANRIAVAAAVASVSTEINFTLIENVASDGVTPFRGNFVVVVGDYTGTLTPDLLSQVTAAVDLVRPITVTFNVLAPTLATPLVNATLSYDLSSGVYTLTGIQTAVQLALYNYFYNLPAGNSFNFETALGIITSTPGVTNCLLLTIDGNGFDKRTGVFNVVGTGMLDGSVTALVQVRPPLTNIQIS